MRFPHRIILACICLLTFYAIFINKQSRKQISIDKSSYVDWHNYTLIELERKRVGPGEQGSAVYLSDEEKKLSELKFRENGFDLVVSDKIAVDRSITDLRDPECKKMLYIKNLLSVSVIIPVFQEHWTTLIRTIVSVVIRSPPNIIKEIILVDDGSLKPFLKDELDTYCSKMYPKNFVRVIHHAERKGLISAKLTGAKNASGDILIFLDSHCEAGINWLPPLIEPIVLDYKTVTCPFIDVIDQKTFILKPQDTGARGAFDWNFDYKRLPRLPEDASHPAKPFESPVMAGGLFAISAKWFWELGGYDPGLAIWGTEQYELSFKIWMCGGRMIDIPCSRVGHIYRGSADFPKVLIKDFYTRNIRRVAEVWMDDYKKYIYMKKPGIEQVETGDLTAQFEIRRRLKCKNFDWFINKVAFDLLNVYPLIEPEHIAKGRLSPLLDLSRCVNTKDNKVYLSECHQETQFKLSWKKGISKLNGDNNCFDIVSGSTPVIIGLYPCHGMLGNQHFELRFPNGTDKNPVKIIQVLYGLCMASDLTSNSVYLERCVDNKNSQLWFWETLQSLKSAKQAASIKNRPH